MRSQGQRRSPTLQLNVLLGALGFVVLAAITSTTRPFFVDLAKDEAHAPTRVVAQSGSRCAAPSNATDELGVLPAGYASAACKVQRVPGPRLVPIDAARGCLPMVALPEAERQAMLAEMRNWMAEIDQLDDAGRTASAFPEVGEVGKLHVVALAGRPYSTEIVLRAVRRMFSDRGGVATLVTIVTTKHQEAFVRGVLERLSFPLINRRAAAPRVVEAAAHSCTAGGLPPSSLREPCRDLRPLSELRNETQLVVFARRHPRDFRDLYNATLVDGFLHLKLDDDLLFVHPNFDLLMLHRYLREKHAALRSDACNDEGEVGARAPAPARCSYHGRVSRLGPRHGNAACSVLGANAVNHVGLGAIHAAMGAVDVTSSVGDKPPLDTDFMAHQPAARWAAQHRTFLQSLLLAASTAQGQTVDDPLRRYDFGLHHYDCDAQPRRWSINAVLFSFGRRVFEAHMPPDDEFFITKMFHTHVEPAENLPHPARICADGRALVVHAAYSFQYLYAAHYGAVNNTMDAREWEDDRRFWGRRRFSGVLARLQEYYLALSKHQDGTEACCRETGCVFFDGGADVDALQCGAQAQPGSAEGGRTSRLPTRLQCTFPYNAGEAWFASLERTFAVASDPLPWTVARNPSTTAPRRTWKAFIQLANVPGVALRIAPNPRAEDAADIVNDNVLECGLEQWRIDSKFFIDLVAGCGSGARGVGKPPNASNFEVTAVRLRPVFLETSCLTLSNSKGPTFVRCPSLTAAGRSGSAETAEALLLRQYCTDIPQVAATDEATWLLVRARDRPDAWHLVRPGKASQLVALGTAPRQSHRPHARPRSAGDGTPLVAMPFDSLASLRDHQAGVFAESRRGNVTARRQQVLAFYFLDARRSAPVYSLQAEQPGDLGDG